MKKTFLRAGLLIPLFLLFFCSSCLNGYFFPQRQYNYVQQFTPFDAIIVPGIPFNPEKGWDAIMQTRVKWACYLYQTKQTNNIIFSGGAVYTPYFESKIMKEYAIALGVDSNHIFTENNARHGVENLYYSYILAKELGFKNIALATDPAQNLQVGYFGRPLAEHVELIPALMDELSKYSNNDITIPYEHAIAPDFKNIEEEPIISRLIKSSGGYGLKKRMNRLIKTENQAHKKHLKARA